MELLEPRERLQRVLVPNPGFFAFVEVLQRLLVLPP
jgi:hypothetical protein